MIYKEFQGLKLSALGMGAMRLPTVDGDEARIDEARTAEMVACAREQGVNYFDTAYGYHAGQSEIVMGRLLGRYPRESYYLADKFPGYDLGNMDKVEAIFEEQLQKCGVDYFDFYLFHNVCEKNIDPYLDEKNGILAYLLKQKENGRIRHLGLSCHGSYQVLERFLNAYGQHMEFCQLQINYLDWDFQDARSRVELLYKWNIPIWVMEPLRGGKLAKLAAADAARLHALRPGETVPGWAFRFLQSIPGVTMVLSGMSDLAQMEANIATYQTEEPLTDAELAVLLDIAHGMASAGTLPCTACRYCTTHCPQELDIPYLLSLYNEYIFTGGGFLAPMAVGSLPADKRPAACIGCRSCEAVCPQQLKISEAMSDFSQKLGLR